MITGGIKDTLMAYAFGDSEHDWLDGLTENYSDYYVQPLMRLNTEARRIEQLDALLDRVTNLPTH